MSRWTEQRTTRKPAITIPRVIDKDRGENYSWKYTGYNNLINKLAPEEENDSL